MRPNVREHQTVARSGDPALNEDAVVITEHFVAVIDGETNKGPAQSPAPGRVAASALAMAVGRLEPGVEPHRMVSELHAAVAAAADATAFMSAVIAVVDLSARRIVRVGDVTVGVNGQFFSNRKAVDRIAAAARAAFTAAEIEDGASVEALRRDDPGRQFVLPLLVRAAAFRNRAGGSFGFGAIDGTATPDELVEVISLPPGPCEVVLASDGYPSPQWSLDSSEALLRELSQLDPLRVRDDPGLKAFKPGSVAYDDRTYVRIAFGDR